MAAIVTSIGKIYSLDSLGSTTVAETRLAKSFPAAREVGQELATSMEQWFRAGRGKRLDNLSDHVERAIAISGREAVEAISESPEFTEWAEGVSKIDFRDPCLADAWQAALIGLETGGARRLRALKVVQRMHPDEASAFQRLTRKKSIDGGEINRLKALGLIKTARDRIFNRMSIFFYLLTFSLASLATTLAMVSTDLFPTLTALWAQFQHLSLLQVGFKPSPAILVFTVGALCTAVPMLFHLFLDATPLTQDGRTMAGLLAKVAAVKTEKAEKPVAAGATPAPKNMPKFAMAV